MKQRTIFTTAFVLTTALMTGCASRNAEEVSIAVYENGADMVDEIPTAPTEKKQVREAIVSDNGKETPTPGFAGNEDSEAGETTPPPKKIRGKLKSLIVCKGGVTADRCAGQGVIASLANEGTVDQRTEVLRVLTNSPSPSRGNDSKPTAHAQAAVAQVPRPGPEAYDDGGMLSNCEKHCAIDFRNNSGGYDNCVIRCRREGW